MPKTYTFNRNGISEQIVREDWRWEAYYSDGSSLKQFNDTDNSFHQLKEIDQSKLTVFKMVNDTHQPLTMLFNPNEMKLVHFYRIIGLDFTGEVKRIKLYVFGYESSGRKWFTVITPTEIVQTDDPDNIGFNNG